MLKIVLLCSYNFKSYLLALSPFERKARATDLLENFFYTYLRKIAIKNLFMTVLAFTNIFLFILLTVMKRAALLGAKFKGWNVFASD